jgi:hypothetical protein
MTWVHGRQTLKAGAEFRRYAYPQYTGVTITDVPIGSARYDSFQSKVTHRFSQGLAVQASFTISKNLEQVSVLNAQDIDLSNLVSTKREKRLTQYDAPRVFAWVRSYELPFGTGKKFGRNLPQLLNSAVGRLEPGRAMDHPFRVSLQLPECGAAHGANCQPPR